MENVKDHGAVGDGLANDTDAIRAALDCGPGTVYFPAGTYRITEEIMVGDGRILEVGAAVITTDATPIPRLFRTVPGCLGVRVYGGTFGEGLHGAGVAWCVDGPEDFVMDGSRLTGARQDGIWIGGPDHTPASNVTLRNVTCDRNIRNGLSIVYAQRVLVDGCLFEGNGGADPSSGADLEPNEHEDVGDVLFTHCTFARNVKNGLYMHKGKGGRGQGYRIVRCDFTGNAGYGLIGNAIDELFIEECDFDGSSIGLSIGDGTTGLTLCYSTVSCPRSVILAAVADPKVYHNILSADIEFIPAGGMQAISGDVYLMDNEAAQ